MRERTSDFRDSNNRVIQKSYYILEENENIMYINPKGISKVLTWGTIERSAHQMLEENERLRGRNEVLERQLREGVRRDLHESALYSKEAEIKALKKQLRRTKGELKESNKQNVKLSNAIRDIAEDVSTAFKKASQTV